jgi:adenylate cyclase
MSDNNELEQLLAEKVKLDSMLMEKFSREITVMFTDIKGSTSYYETRGDLAGRTMIHQHNSIVLPLIEKHKGTLLKTIGDATMSIYEDPADGLRAAAEIQHSLLAYNKDRPVGEQINVRCGLNCGVGLVENNDSMRTCARPMNSSSVLRLPLKSRARMSRSRSFVLSGTRRT